MRTNLSTTAAKAEFIKSIHTWLMNTLDKNGKSEYKNCFTMDGSSIMCSLPTNYFNNFTIPEGMKVEMKFILKR